MATVIKKELKGEVKAMNCKESDILIIIITQYCTSLIQFHVMAGSTLHDAMPI
jgi:hypothetical protein